MASRFLHCCFLFFFATGLASAAVPEKDIRFRHLNTSNGLAQGTVNTIAQDAQGYLWLGTDGGLVRYDGYQSTVFKHDPADPASVADNMISAIFPTARGGLWVASYGNLQLFDPATGKFTRHLSDDSGGSVLRGIRQVISDGAGGIWIGSGTGLRRILADGHRVQYTHDPSNAASLGSDAVRALAPGRDGKLWIGTTSGVDRLDPATGRFEHFRPDPRSVPDPDRNSVRALLASGGKLWIGTRKGLAIWDVSGAAPAALKLPAELPDETMIRTMMEDHRGRYWFATENGLLLWDPQSATSRRYRHHTDLPHSLGDNYVYSLFQDRSCILWVGTYFGGASHVDLCREGIEAYSERADGKDGLSSGKVLAITAAGDQRLWVGTAGGGVNLLDPAKGTVQQFRHDPNNPRSLSGDDATAVAVDRDGSLWVGTRSGMNVMRGGSGRFERFRMPGDTVTSNYVVLLRVDSRGMLWAGTLGGLYRIEPRTMHTSRYPLGKPGENVAGDNEVWAICDMGDGYLWVGTSNGIKRLNLEKGGFEHFGPEAGLNHRIVTAIAPGRDGRLWVSTNAGLNEVLRLPDGQVKFRTVGQAEGLSNVVIKAVLPGVDKDLWLSTSAGITHFDPERRFAEHFNETDGVADTDHLQGAAYRAADGTLYFGGFAKGLTKIRPQEIKRNLHAPQVLITDFKVLNRSQQRAGTAQLDYQDNMVSFEFAAPQLAAAEANRYAYRLVGFDSNWIETDATKRSATFTNLSPGAYSFEVKAANKNGVWSAEPRTLQLEILPPFWLTWPFRILVAALVLMLLLAAYKLRVRHFALQQRKLESQVRERTAELALTQQKLVLNEKMAAIGTLTAGVAHEINNPVNFAHGGAQLLSDELEEFRQFLLALAGSDADAKVLQALNTRFDHLVGRTALIHEGTTRIRELVQDLRTFSRLDQAEKKAVPIAENILSTVKLVQTQYAEDTDIVCELAVNPTLECWPARLNQVFMNLIVNACQANREKRAGKQDAPRGSLHIRTRLSGQALAIEFADSGNGIAPEVAKRMFEPFYTTKPEGEGTGLGLSIAFAIVQKHGGSLSARSVAGQGAVLTVTLPLSLAAEPA